MFEQSRKKVAAQHEAAEALRAKVAENVELASRGRDICPQMCEEGSLHYHQDAEKAAAASLGHAESDLSRALEELEAARHADRVARFDESKRVAAEATKIAIAAQDAAVAIFDEDPKRLISPECQFLILQMRHWAGIVELQINPPPPPALDPSMKLVKFTKSVSGYGASDFRRSITAFGLGETAAFGKAELAFLLELGVVELVLPDTTDEEAA